MPKTDWAPPYHIASVYNFTTSPLARVYFSYPYYITGITLHYSITWEHYITLLVLQNLWIQLEVGVTKMLYFSSARATFCLSSIQNNGRTLNSHRLNVQYCCCTLFSFTDGILERKLLIFLNESIVCEKVRFILSGIFVEWPDHWPHANMRVILVFFLSMQFCSPAWVWDNKYKMQ